ncbi:hypothetical protein [Paenirhodobacter populi]|uniref:Uncharacterized protein n=1 Tax=Paenirhodobacter populi TaxID=2306993 RepID=A0A443J1M8_9RHOB|nr:hypothetical protein [Sinirhodobacter populi]RWR04876.1 hypothetical protein D2T32_18370 [Sinirhodobacter populi]RWR14303.1 hypothetical protein D2T33_03565 [Sinirhodobacter populi]RWR17707.1 hypothetical protein D2T30_18345 [Sinirhodobacter populi]RWR31947.1 hypothetical protein D2T31_03015 [Sinirhodobacter populi]RWR33700.1 hypothetical protein D2T29_05370 [Sinirhodobacter populi]
MDTDRHTVTVRNAATHSYRPVRHLQENGNLHDEAHLVCDIPVLGEDGRIAACYVPLHPHVQE